jgi:hypothetical protein
MSDRKRLFREFMLALAAYLVTPAIAATAALYARQMEVFVALRSSQRRKSRQLRACRSFWCTATTREASKCI